MGLPSASRRRGCRTPRRFRRCCRSRRRLRRIATRRGARGARQGAAPHARSRPYEAQVATRRSSRWWRARCARRSKCAPPCWPNGCTGGSRRRGAIVSTIDANLQRAAEDRAYLARLPAHTSAALLVVDDAALS
ncbi:hypothetical protein [Rhodanobacter lindaniclasticus]